MKEPKWIDRRALMLLQRESLAAHGGRAGVRDNGLLESALARARQLWTYEANADLARLAAAYGAGVVQNHPFADGNKRAAFLAVGLFLGLNGYQLIVDPADAARTVFAVAADEMSELEFAAWIRIGMRPHNWRDRE